MIFGSLFTGIGGIDLGLERSGMRCAWQCEIDEWRRGILARHWPDVPRFADVRDVSPSFAAHGVGHSCDDGRDRIDLLCGGFPCQDVSIAGRRAGLAGARTSLFFEFARIAESLRPRWLLLENVPGLLSSHRGRDFAVVLSTLVELGYGVAWRVVDSRYFGVPQRRRRVFLVGHLGARSPEPFLSFLEGLSGDLETCAEEGTDVAVASLCGLGSGGPDDNDGKAGRIVAHSLTGEGHDASEDGTGRGTPLVAGPLGGGNDGIGRRTEDDPNLVTQHGVRRLTPVECCRLQGFPDDWLGLPNELPDSPRYRALGDAVTVNVAQWIGERIMESGRGHA